MMCSFSQSVSRYVYCIFICMRNYMILEMIGGVNFAMHFRVDIELLVTLYSR